MQLAVHALLEWLFLTCFNLLGYETNPFSGQNLAIFSHFMTHDGSKIAPIPEILTPKILSALSLSLRHHKVQITTKNYK